MEKIDLSNTITPKSDQLNADDLIGGAKTIKITNVKKIDSETQPVSIYFEGDNNKPYKPSKGMRRVLVQLWGDDGSQFIGKGLTLFRDEDVTYGGSEVGGIRISHASGITKPTRVIVTISKNKRRPITILPLVDKKPLMKDAMKAKEAIDKGDYTFEQIAEMYDLTDEQVTILKAKKQ